MFVSLAPDDARHAQGWPGVETDADREVRSLPSHDIAIANTVWCIAYKRGSGGASYTAE